MTGRRLDLSEAMANAVIGLVVSWLATWLVLGYEPSAAAGVTMMFFGLSFARAWLLRRMFRRMALQDIQT